MRTLDRPSVEMVCPGSNAADRGPSGSVGGGAKTYPVMRLGSAVYLDPSSIVDRTAPPIP
jgi:hypothetical protein